MMVMKSSKSRLGKVKNSPNVKKTKIKLIKQTRKTNKKKRNKNKKTKKNLSKKKSKRKKTIQSNKNHAKINNLLTEFPNLKNTNRIKSMNPMMIIIDLI
jgi:hypothetical protein